MTPEKFEVYAIVELFGHNKIAGKVTEQTLGGATMLRIDVPETKSQPAFTRFMHINAVYAINPVTEEVATQYAENLKVMPIQSWDAREVLNRIDEQKKLAQPKYDQAYEDNQRAAEDDLEDDEDDEPFEA
jgi:hypothetical protein